MASSFPPQPQLNPPPVNAGINSRVVAAGAGAAWWGKGWRLFKTSIWTWIGIVIVYFVLSALLSHVPYVGSFAQWLLSPVFLGGIMSGCHAIDRGESLRFAHLFDGFKEPHFIPLLFVGAVNMGLAILIVGIAFAAFAGEIGFSALMGFPSSDFDPYALWRSLGLLALLGIFLALLVATVLAMVNWFAPALIVLQGAKPIEAMKASFRTCMRNWVPFLVYGAIAIAAGSVLMIPLFAMLGLFALGVSFGTPVGPAILAIIALFPLCVAIGLVVTSMVFGSTYAGYRDTLATQDSTPDIPA